MSIQIADNRPALSIAIAHAREQGEERLPAWEAELTQMVIEVTRKFHGSLTTENVRRGLDTSVGVLSLGLMHASRGGVDPELWHGHLQQTTFKEISKQAVELVKQCAALPATDFLQPGSMDFDLSPREHLLRFARTGYKALRAMEADRRRNKRQVELARWLLQNTAIGASARRHFGSMQENVTAGDIFSYILPRQAGITGEHLKMEAPEDDPIQAVDDSLDDLDFGGDKIVLPPRLWTQAKKRFDAFAETIPSELKLALFEGGESWFDIHVARLERARPTGKTTATTPKAKKTAPAKAKKPAEPKATKTAKAKATAKKTPQKKTTPKAAPKAPKAPKSTKADKA